MLQQANRLKKRKEFGYIYRNGTALYSKDLVVMYTTNKFKRTKFGFAVSNKVGKAYVRNIVKRRLRAIVRLNMASVVSSRNYVIIARPTIASCTYEDVEQQLLQLLSKVQ